MDPITMMVASIGMQFFNNYANSKKNEEIQEKQREFQRAAAVHDFERMRKLQAESAKLALELEAEVHKERVEDINNNYDALLDNFAHSFAIQNWPLNVLPFVMKGESFGTLFNGTTQSVNLHCILTPSNCEWFNREFYDDIDLRLEAEMNNKWNAQTTHPIVYYGGAWNRRSMNKGISVPNVVDLDDIELLRVKLKDVPVVVITPYFDPWLHFKVKLWGMGKDSDAPYRIDIPHGNDIEFSQRIFSYDYHKDDTELTEDFENTTIEEFVPYLECLIGFIADKYFWSVYGIKPILPSLCQCNLNRISRILELPEKYKAIAVSSLSSTDIKGVLDGIDFISSIDYDKEGKELSTIISTYFHSRGQSYDDQITVIENISNLSATLDDLIIIHKLAEKKYIPFQLFTTLRQNVVSDDCIAVYSISELFDLLYNDYRIYDKYVFTISDGKICIGYLFKNSIPLKSLTIVLYNSAKHTNDQYEFNTNLKSCQVYNNKLPLLTKLPTAILNESHYNSLNHTIVGIRNQITLGEDVFRDNCNAFEDAIFYRVTISDVKKWLHSNLDNASSVKIIKVIFRELYYIILIQTDKQDNILQQKSYAMYSVDPQMNLKFNNKLILTIKK